MYVYIMTAVPVTRVAGASWFILQKSCFNFQFGNKTANLYGNPADHDVTRAQYVCCLENVCMDRAMRRVWSMFVRARVCVIVVVCVCVLPDYFFWMPNTRHSQSTENRLWGFHLLSHVSALNKAFWCWMLLLVQLGWHFLKSRRLF